MRQLSTLLFLPLTLFLASCDHKKAEEEVDYESMVRLDEADEEWNSLHNLDDKVIAGDLLPDSQEIILPEWVDVEPLDTSPTHR